MTTSPPRAARVAVALCFALCGALFATWVTRIPAIQAKLAMNHATLGLVLLSSSVGALIAMPLTGVAIAHFGSRLVSQVVVFFFVASLPWLAVAPTPLLLAVALLVLGAFYGAVDVAVNAQAVAVEERYGRPIMGSFHALFSLGGLCGAAIGGFVTKEGATPLAHFGGVVLTVGLFTIVVALPRLLRTPIHPTSEPRPKFTWPPRSLLAIGAVAFCAMMAEGSVADWGAIFLHRDLGADEGTAAGGFAAFSVTMALARFCGDRLAARWGTVRLIRGAAATAVAGLLLVLSVHHVGAALAGFAAMGVGLAPIIPLVFSAAGRTPGMKAGPALAVTTTVGYFGFLFGPPFIGFVAEAYGLRQGLAIIAVAGLAIVVLARRVEPAE